MFETLQQIMSYSAVLIFAYMTYWFFLSLVAKRNDIADIAWGIGFVLLTTMLYIKSGAFMDRSFIILVLVAVWGFRLAFHIRKRNANKPEDKRYAAWRLAWGNWVIPRSFLQIYMLQGFLLLLISTPIMIANAYHVPGWGVFEIVGIIIWIIGFYFESQGDKQLKNFLANPENKGRVLNTGLWKYTRHPNYFGEVTMWWGIWIITLGLPFWWIGILGPLTISFLILKVSGVPMLEKGMEANPLFDEYRAKTSRFFPRKPKI